jgi:hypothetical protein
MKRWNQQNGCTHQRDKSKGHMVRRGDGEWMTGGQVLTNGDIALLCTRCQVQWIFKPTNNELDFANNAGLMGFPPPEIERCTNRANFLKERPKPPRVLAEAV